MAKSTILILKARQCGQYTVHGGSFKPVFKQCVFQWPGLRHEEVPCTPKRLSTELFHFDLLT
jgi:hypothetical protein